MSDFVVLQTLKVNRSTRYICRGTVVDAPYGTRPRDVVALIDTAGRAPHDAGIAWANHTCRTAASAPPSEVAPDAWRLTWTALEGEAAKPVLRQLNVRIPQRLYDEVDALARREGVPVRAWVEQALRDRADAFLVLSDEVDG